MAHMNSNETNAMRLFVELADILFECDSPFLHAHNDHLSIVKCNKKWFCVLKSLNFKLIKIDYKYRLPHNHIILKRPKSIRWSSAFAFPMKIGDD